MHCDDDISYSMYCLYNFLLAILDRFHNLMRKSNESVAACRVHNFVELLYHTSNFISYETGFTVVFHFIVVKINIKERYII